MPLPHPQFDLRRRLLWIASAFAIAVTTLIALPGANEGNALGPVRAITPIETSPQAIQGEPTAVSERGGTVGIIEQERSLVSFVRLDAAGADPLIGSEGISVSGDGCAAVWMEVVGGEASRIRFEDRCNPANTRVLFDFPTRIRNFRSALSFDGRFAAMQLGGGNTNLVFRFDTRNVNAVVMPTQPLPGDDTVAEMGIDISDDGAFIAVTVRRRAPVIGLRQTSQPFFVAGWQVGSDPVVVSTSNGTVPGSAAYPSVSGDGRYVAFAADFMLTGAELKSGGPWIYVRDRTRSDFRLVSPAGEAAYYTSISTDATQVAYGHLPSQCPIFDGHEFQCPPNRIDVAYGSTRGLTGGFQIETVSLDVNGRVIGEHHDPRLSGNGRYIAWRSNRGDALTGNPQFSQEFHAFIRRRDPGLQVTASNFGSLAAPGTATRTSTVTNIGRDTISIGTISTNAGEFVVTGGSCSIGLTLSPGSSCSVDVRFTANAPARNVNGALTVGEVGYDPVSAVGALSGAVTVTTTTRPGPTTTPPRVTTTLAVTTTSTGGQGPIITVTLPPTTTLPGVTVISATPDPLDFGDTAVLIPTAIRTITVSNTGTAPGDVVAFLGGENPGDFELVGGSCTQATLLAASSCTLDYRMTPLAAGGRSAILTLEANGASTTVQLVGIGRFEPRLIVSPEAVTERGIATVIGQGFPPGEPVAVDIVASGVTLNATPDADGMFRIALMPIGRLRLGSHRLETADVPSLYVGPDATMMVVLPTFTPQGPTGPAFANSLLVARG